MGISSATRRGIVSSRLRGSGAWLPAAWVVVVGLIGCAPAAEGQSPDQPSGRAPPEVSDVTREHAASLIAKSTPFADVTIHRTELALWDEDRTIAVAEDRGALDREVSRSLAKLGYVRIVNPNDEPLGESRAVEWTDKGKTAFPISGEAGGHSRSEKTLSISVRRRELIEVTGLAALRPGFREAQFRWRWVLTPFAKELASSCAEFRRLFVSTQARDGVAVLRQFDDGWRLEEISLDAGLATTSAMMVRRMVAARIVECPSFTEPVAEWIPIGCDRIWDKSEEAQFAPIGRALVQLGYLKEEKGKERGYDDHIYTLTSKAGSAFKLEGDRSEAFYRWKHRTAPFLFADRELIRITGIALKEPGVRKVVFLWRWRPTKIAREIAGVDRSVASDFASVQCGQATLLLFDDGWRFEKVTIRN